jgi:hypothetical protein
MSTGSEGPARQRKVRILDGRVLAILLLATWALLFLTFAP